MTVKLAHTTVKVTPYITAGVPALSKAENISVCLTPGPEGGQGRFAHCKLSVVRNGDTVSHRISKSVAAELIAHGIPYQG